ncbi:helix-turn-helix domain-containing protein [Acetobacteraceae bacterium KSS8]|uniref:Helix-turn-helix domain-containing protein n=1 Tax=Endosaccharibacter trunci TaxID=2812733 RepID=A0ABT1W7H7_9PROT|nr:helix-turn-helix domain-containing protein [Acetobacteraceae bacterium KSS8]
MTVTETHRPLTLLPAGSVACMTCGARSASVCNAVEERDLRLLEGAAEKIRIAPGAPFMVEGAPADCFFNITSGTARLVKLLPDGRRQVTGFADAGRFLGLAATERFGFGAEAIDAVTACRFSRKRLRGLIDDVPLLERRLLASASSELAAAQEQLLLLGRKTALERVASFLLERQAALPVCRGGDETVSLPMGRGDIADYLGLTIETISRTLGMLKTRGCIAVDKASEIRIRLPARMRALAAGED